jgi:signal transduction histidine kinase
VLVNLTTNACKFSKRGQDVYITLKKVEKLLILEVTDQGLGISQEDQHNLFKQFF